MTNQIDVYTDGACSGNPGVCGIGIVFLWNNQSKEYSENLGQGTNNIAELTAVLRTFQLIKYKNYNINIYTDSQYVLGLLTDQYYPKKNKQLINNIKKEMKKFKSVNFYKVKGHSDDQYNNQADKLAVQSIKK